MPGSPHSLARHALRRLALLVPTVWGVATLVFLFLRLLPGDPVDLMLGEQAGSADREALRHALGLDLPLPRQYARFLGGLLRGDLGTSLRYRVPVADLVLGRYPATIELGGAALLVALALALPLGILAARREGGAVDRGALAYALAAVSLPTIGLGPALIVLFALHWRLLPVSGRSGPESLVLPALTLGLGMGGMLSRLFRESLREILADPFVTAARAKGIPEGRLWLRHLLPNALLPVLTILVLQVGAVLSGAIVTETLFAWPGVGRLLVGAIQSRDYPVVQGAIVLIAAGYVAVNLAGDLLYAWADPRIRLG